MSELQPTHVTVKEARRLCGDESHGGIYIALGAGELRAIKRGKRTLIEVASIRERLANCPAAVIKPDYGRKPSRRASVTANPAA